MKEITAEELTIKIQVLNERKKSLMSKLIDFELKSKKDKSYSAIHKKDLENIYYELEELRGLYAPTKFEK